MTQEEFELGRHEKLPLGKLHAAQYIVTLVLLVLGVGLWRLQVIGSDTYRVLAEENRVRKVPVLAPRGRLLDREGRIIVDNYPSVTCYLLREKEKSITPDLPLIASGLHMTLEQLQGIIQRFGYGPGYAPVPLKRDITPDEQAFIAAHKDELPELETLDEQRRLYPRDGFMAHLIGYVGQISPNDLTNQRYAAYLPGDIVGKSGVEEAYDGLLRGTNGSRNVVVNSHGKEVGTMGQEIAIAGQDLRLTVDLDIQMAAERALEGKTGAIVAMDPHTGEVLAMASRPIFDPNQFLHLTPAYWKSIIDDPNHPLMNKALQAQLAPGSTFKVIMTYAGLEENAAQDMRVACNGGATFYGHFFSCDRHHGSVDIHSALPYSCDTFYYTLANRLGIGTIARYASSVGIGVKTGIDLPDENAGIMPSESWKLKTQHDKWYAGETISVGIGQGAVQATPMQLARALSGLASGGSLVRPHVVFSDEITKDQLEAVQETFPGSGVKQVPLSTANWQIITDDMANVTQSGIGTAAEARLEGIDFAGKTGTADVVSGRKKGDRNRATIPNAWFVGMAPRRNPDIVVAVLWEHGYWGNNSAKLAAQVINAYVTKQRAHAGNLMKLAQAPPPVPAPPSSEIKPDTQPAKPEETPTGQ